MSSLREDVSYHIPVMAGANISVHGRSMIVSVLKPRLSKSQLTSGRTCYDRALVTISSLNAMQTLDNAQMHSLEKGSSISDIRLLL
jgi:hypothetical protein